MERIATEHRRLPGHLTDEEIVGKAQELAAVITDLGLMEDRHSDFRAKMKAEREGLQELAAVITDLALMEDRHADFRAKIKAEREGLEARLGALASQISRRVADKDVEVEVRGDFARGIAEEIRTDTGEVLGTRSLRTDEYQSLLPGAGGAPAHAEDP